MNVLRLSLILVCLAASSRAALLADDVSAERGLVKHFCVECHNSKSSEAGVDFDQLLTEDAFVNDYRDWQNAVEQLQQKRMPPEDAEQPTNEQRQQLQKWIGEQISVAAKAHEGDPGHVVIRRLTSAEYGYAIFDLTGIDINVERGFVPDAVGGAGFTNTGIVQFTQDSTLERYLEAARHVADHAVVGTGPLTFFRDPGQTGFELSAIDRIQKIYRKHGFRTAAGEGGEPFGLARYTRAFYAAWMYRHRKAGGQPEATLADCASSVGIDARFAEYIHSVLTRPKPSFPTSNIIEAWEKLPPYQPDGETNLLVVAGQCQNISDLLLEWQNRFGSNTDAKEEAPVLRADLFDVQRTQPFEMNVNWPKGTKTAHLVLSVESANRNGKPDAVIQWRDAKIQFRDYEKVLQEPRPLRDFLTKETVTRLGFGKHPRGGQPEQNAFVTVGTRPPAFELPIPDGAGSARLFLTAELDTERGEDSIVRCTISQLEETDQGKSVSGLLANPKGKAFDKWKSGVLEFARLLPQMSQREPAPSDRDPIPAPIDPTYNNAERNFFHTRIKYFRDDNFLVENILDDETRLELDQAWADLLGSFEFHDTWLALLAKKYRFDLDGRKVAGIDDNWIDSTPEETRNYLRALKVNYDRSQSMFRSAESRHLRDVIQFASAAWRRPLSNAEANELYGFYKTLRSDSQLDHRSAICAVLARILVSPSFLYRAERSRPGDDSDQVRPLSQTELASRLSFLLWSSVPDDELRRAAIAGELSTPKQLTDQTRRMLRDPRSRRFAEEFFGQWFGFYRFGQFRGIDTEQFPEFSDSLRESMYGEAVEFFDFIVRRNRPVNEILNAKYSFVNRELAEHYGLDVSVVNRELAQRYGQDISVDESSKLQRIELASRSHRGGLLRLGAVLATTSAPRRTSPVKRGDWILRRVLGTSVPPPPADAGSIASDEVVADGLSIRKRLEAHRRDLSCHNCHARFDAFGFALENYDPLGRWRDRYRDGKPVETVGILSDGKKISGDEGLHLYLASQEHRFHETLARRLIGYSLGRRESVGDLNLLSRLTDDMKRGGGMPDLLVRIVTSRQFRYHRSVTSTGGKDSVSKPPAQSAPPEDE
jgi:hypothetical protein